MDPPEKEIVAVVSSSSTNSSGDETSQRLANKSRRWLSPEMHQGIVDALQDLKEFSYGNLYKKGGKEGEVSDTFINKKVREVRILTSRLAFRAAKLEKQVSCLKQENAEHLCIIALLYS